MNRSNDEIGSHGCPPALKCLVFVWDELNKDFQTFVAKIMSDKENKDGQAQAKVNPNEANELDFSKNKIKSKKIIDEGNTLLSGAVGGANESTIWCELCEADIGANNFPSSYQQNAFTQHLKANHPGCGESSKGKGYNSNGVYCEGWAGQCGEEGVGASSWYLLCESCREKYLAPGKKAANVNDPLLIRVQELKVIPPPSINPSTFSKKSKFSSNMSTDFFDTMRDNALFLLDLNSHNGGLMNKATTNNLIPLKNKLNARHSSASDFQIASSSVPQRLSATALEENIRKTTLQKQNSTASNCTKKCFSGELPDLLWTPPESITCLDMLNAKISESDSCNLYALDNEKIFFDPLGFGQQQANLNQDAAIENKFHRSFSMIQGWRGSLSTLEDHEHDCTSGSQLRQNNESRVVMRRKKTCLCDSCEFRG